MSWQPKPEDVRWTRTTFEILKVGGVWACPAGKSVWSRSAHQAVTLLEGDPEAECNDRIIKCILAMGWTYIGTMKGND